MQIFIQVFLIFMVFNFSFLYQNLSILILGFVDSNENYMTMKIYNIYI